MIDLHKDTDGTYRLRSERRLADLRSEIISDAELVRRENLRTALLVCLSVILGATAIAFHVSAYFYL